MEHHPRSQVPELNASPPAGADGVSSSAVAMPRGFALDTIRALVAIGTPIDVAACLLVGGNVEHGSEDFLGVMLDIRRHCAMAALRDVDHSREVAMALLDPSLASDMGWTVVEAALEVARSCPDLSWVQSAVAASRWEGGARGDRTLSSLYVDLAVGSRWPFKKVTDKMAFANARGSALAAVGCIEYLAMKWRFAKTPKEGDAVTAHMAAPSIGCAPAWLAATYAADVAKSLRAPYVRDSVQNGNGHVAPPDYMPTETMGHLKSATQAMCAAVGGDPRVFDGMDVPPRPGINGLTFKPAAGSDMGKGGVVCPGSLDLSNLSTLRNLDPTYLFVEGDLVLDGLGALECLPSLVAVEGRIMAKGCDQLRAWLDGQDGNGGHWAAGVRAQGGGVVW